MFIWRKHKEKMRQKVKKRKKSDRKFESETSNKHFMT